MNWVGRSQDALLRRLVFVIGGGVGSVVVDWMEEEEEEEEERVLAWWFCHGYWGGDCRFLGVEGWEGVSTQITLNLLVNHFIHPILILSGKG